MRNEDDPRHRTRFKVRNRLVTQVISCGHERLLTDSDSQTEHSLDSGLFKRSFNETYQRLETRIFMVLRDDLNDSR